MKKTIVVIGGSSGIGLETSKLLSSKEYEVIIGSRKPLKNSKINHKKIDVTNEKSIINFFSDINMVDGLVYSVGIPFPKNSILNFSKEKWNKVMDINVTGAILSLKHSYEKLKASKGKVVIVNSIAARYHSLFSGIEYTMSKSALSGMVRHLSIEFAKDGILINTVFPSMTGTEMLYNNVGRDKLNTITKKIPLNKLASTKDVAHAISFLLNKNNTYITGSGIDINGGQFLTG